MGNIRFFKKLLKTDENQLVRRATIINKLIARNKKDLAIKIICSAAKKSTVQA